MTPRIPISTFQIYEEMDRIGSSALTSLQSVFIVLVLFIEDVVAVLKLAASLRPHPNFVLRLRSYTVSHEIVMVEVPDFKERLRWLGRPGEALVGSGELRFRTRRCLDTDVAENSTCQAGSYFFSASAFRVGTYV